MWLELSYMTMEPSSLCVGLVICNVIGAFIYDNGTIITLWTSGVCLGKMLVLRVFCGYVTLAPGKYYNISSWIYYFIIRFFSFDGSYPIVYVVAFFLKKFVRRRFFPVEVWHNICGRSNNNLSTRLDKKVIF
jgi:hypothetical protein